MDDVSPGKTLGVRVDINSPVEDGEVADNRRFARHAETVSELLADDHAVVLLAHQGRPGREDFASLAGHAEVFAGHLDRSVEFVDDVHGDRAVAAVEDVDPGEVVLLENVRMSESELTDRTPAEHAESALVSDLAPHFDAYVNDAYSAAHRAHASLVGFPPVVPSFGGRVMAAEYEYNSSVRDRAFDGPVTMVLGGTKVADLVGVMERLKDRVDNFLLGGVVGELFLRARGYDVGYDVADETLYDDQWAATADRIRSLLAEHDDTIQLPVDLAYEGPDGERAEETVAGIEKTQPFLDVGSQTVTTYAPYVRESAATFVKGALGVFEDERFAHGTVGVLEAIAEGDGFSVVGGGDTGRAISLYGLDETAYDHVSLAGGAYLRALTGDPLPAVEALQRYRPDE
ncbi:MAG: phosphoglycerate kinase [Halobacteriaceae archaeon]